MKRSASFYLGIFLIGVLPLVALNCPSELEKAADLLGNSSAYSVSDATGLPSFTYSGTTSITFTSGEVVTEGTFTVSGAANLPRIVVNSEQVDFPSSGSYVAAGTDNITSITLDGDTGDITLSVTTFSEDGNTLNFTYSGAEPKAADLATVTVTTSR